MIGSWFFWGVGADHGVLVVISVRIKNSKSYQRYTERDNDMPPGAACNCVQSICSFKDLEKRKAEWKIGREYLRPIGIYFVQVIFF